MYLQKSNKPVTVELYDRTLRNLEFITLPKAFPDQGIARIPEEVDAVSVAIREVAAYLLEEQQMIPEKPDLPQVVKAWSSEEIPPVKKRTTTREWLLDGKTYHDLKFLLTHKIIFPDETTAVSFAIDRMEGIIRGRNIKDLSRVEKIYNNFISEK